MKAKRGNTITKPQRSAYTGPLARAPSPRSKGICWFSVPIVFPNAVAAAAVVVSAEPQLEATLCEPAESADPSIVAAAVTNEGAALPIRSRPDESEEWTGRDVIGTWRCN